jgi:hypothetical protein
MDHFANQTGCRRVRALAATLAVSSILMGSCGGKIDQGETSGSEAVITGILDRNTNVGSAGGAYGGGSADGTGGGSVDNGTGGSVAGGCTNTMPEAMHGTVTLNAWASAVYSYGDGATTICSSSPVPGTICLEGVGAEACGDSDPCDYHQWGAGLGIALTTGPVGQEVGLDANAAGIAQVRFSLSAPPTVPGSGVRTGVSSMDDPNTFENETHHPFFVGVSGELPTAMTTDTTAAHPWSDFKLPLWDEGLALSLDTTNLSSLHFMVVTVPYQVVAYDFCISDIRFLDASGNEVTKDVSLQR